MTQDSCFISFRELKAVAVQVGGMRKKPWSFGFPEALRFGRRVLNTDQFIKMSAAQPGVPRFDPSFQPLVVHSPLPGEMNRLSPSSGNAQLKVLVMQERLRRVRLRGAVVFAFFTSLLFSLYKDFNGQVVALHFAPLSPRETCP